MHSHAVHTIGARPNHIRISLLKLLKSPVVVLMPEFKQIFSVEAGGEDAPFHHTLIGLTKVYLFPFPSFSDTVYLWKLSDGSIIPVGYGIYELEEKTGE